jgi:FMN reductase
MPQSFHVVAIVGSTSERSRTQALVESLVASLAEQVPIEVETLSLRTLAPHIAIAHDRESLGPVGSAALTSIERADLLIAATPVYKGTFAGLFKHLIDFIPPNALVGRPVLLAATGGSDRHALAIDHGLRPLFTFFRAQTVPSAVYASETDFDGLAVRSPALQARIDEAALQAARLLPARAPAAAIAAAA